MNVERLLEFIDEVLALEATHNAQTQLQKLDSAVQALVNSLQDASQQTNAHGRVTELRDALTRLHDDVTPAAWRYLQEAGHSWAFTPLLADDLEAHMNANALTPAAARQSIEKAVNRRQTILDLFQKTATDLRALGFDTIDLEPGQAQLGFTIPRGLFEDTLGGFAEELKQLDRVMGFVAEAVEGEHERSTLVQLSTTDPLVVAATPAAVALAIGQAIKFFIKQWKEVEHIRRLREETRALKIANDAAMRSFDDHLNTVVEQAVENRVKEVMPVSADGRDNELMNALRWSFRYLMSRVERGMTVEVRFLPPAKTQPEQGVEGDATEQSTPDPVFEQLAEVRQDLLFDTLDIAEPLLALEAPMPPEITPKNARKRGRRKKALGDSK